MQHTLPQAALPSPLPHPSPASPSPPPSDDECTDADIAKAIIKRDFALTMNRVPYHILVDADVFELAPVYHHNQILGLRIAFLRQTAAARVLRLEEQGHFCHVGVLLTIFRNLQVFHCENTHIENEEFYIVLDAARENNISFFEIRASKCKRVHFDHEAIIDILCNENSMVRVFKLDNCFQDRILNWEARILTLLNAIGGGGCPIEILGLPHVAWSKIAQESQPLVLSALSATFIYNLCLSSTPKWLRATLAANGKKSIGTSPTKWTAILQSDDAVPLRLNLITFLLCNEEVFRKLPTSVVYFIISFFPHYLNVGKPSWK
jgi:hypothetical protein